MPKCSHTGRDNTLRAKFRIIRIEPDKGLVELLFKKDGWDTHARNEVALPWAEFVQGIMEGRYELSPTKHSKI